MTGLICCTLKCNLACKYCYEGNGQNLCVPDIRDINFKFERSIPKFIDFVDQIYKLNHDKLTKIILHGGEPTLIHPNLIGQIMEDQSQKGHKIIWAIQSNGTLITDEYIRLFKKYKVSVGISLDGLEKNHDKYRIYKNGNPTYKTVISNIRRLNDSDVPCGVLLTITDENVKDLLPIYMELSSLKVNFNYNALFPSNSSDYATLDNSIFVKHICDLYDNWIEDENSNIVIYPFERIMQGLINDKDGDPGCHWRPDCSKSFIAIDTNGDLYPCEHWVGNKDFCFGNISEGLEKSLEKNRYFEHRSEKLQVSDCKNCPAWRMCYGGCPWNAKIATGHINKKDPSICISRRIIVEHIYEYMKNHLPLNS